jgi:hypothetical protein
MIIRTSLRVWRRSRRRPRTGLAALAGAALAILPATVSCDSVLPSSEASAPARSHPATPAPARGAAGTGIGVVTYPVDPGGMNAFSAMLPMGSGTLLVDSVGYAVWCDPVCHEIRQLTDGAGVPLSGSVSGVLPGGQPVIAGLSMSGGRAAWLVIERCAGGSCAPAGGGQFPAPGPDPRLTVSMADASTNGLGFVAIIARSAPPAGLTELYALVCESVRCAHPALVRLGQPSTDSVQGDWAVAATPGGGFVVAVTPGEVTASGLNIATIYECAQWPCRTVTQHHVPVGTSAKSLALSVTANDTVMLAGYVVGARNDQVVLWRCRSCAAPGASFTTLDVPVIYSARYVGGPPPPSRSMMMSF